MSMNKDKNLALKEVFNLAVQNHQNNNLKDAQDYYQKVLNIDPNFAPAHNNLGIISKILDENLKAKSYYEKAIEINPDYIAAHNNLGIIFKDLGQYQKAKRCYEKAIEIDPNNKSGHNNLGVILNNLGKRQKAKSSFEKAIKINPNLANSYWNLHGQSSSEDEALSILKKLYKIDNKNTKAKITISALEGYKGNYDYYEDILSSSD